MRKNSEGSIFTTLAYLFCFFVPATIIALAFFGQNSRYPNFIGWLPTLILYCLPPLINLIWRPSKASLESSKTPRSSRPLYYKLLPMMGVLLQFAALWMAVFFWKSGQLSWFGKTGWCVSVGVFSALFAINLGHELMHRGSRLERFFSGLILSSVCFGCFKVAHLRVHHRHVGTPLDFASSQYRQSIFSYWRQAFVGNFIRSVQIEWALIHKSNKHFFQSELFWWTAISIVIAAFMALYAGVSGILFFVAQSLVAILKLEMINYLQHYGLQRKKQKNGQYEPVNAQHAWSQSSPFTNFVVLNLLCHADHHNHPGRAYEQLGLHKASPEYPYDLSIMLLLTLFPPLFFSVADKPLKALAS